MEWATLCSKSSSSVRVRRVDVLVVDDESSIRDTIAEILRGHNLTVEEAADAKSALSLLRRLDVGVVLLDLKLPDLGGLSLVDQLEEPPPIVLTTARSFDEEIKKRWPKIVAYFQKPYSPESLVAVVTRCLGAE